MIRLAASTGLKPHEFWAMTLREFELWCEGQADKWDQTVELLAWVQANLINVHIPKGKARVTVQKLLPKKQRRKHADDATADIEEEKLEASVAFAQGERGKRSAKLALDAYREEKADVTAFWDSEQGRRLRVLMADLAGVRSER